MSRINIFAQVLQLELRKQKKTFFSIWLVIVLSVVVVSFVLPYLTGTDSLRILRLMLSLILSQGVPLLAAVFTALPAAALRREPDASIEQGLPAHPRIRIFGALAAAVVFFALTFVLLVLSSALFVSNEGFSDLLGAVSAASVSLTWLLLLMQIQAMSFACAYWLRLPFVGGSLAVIAGYLELSLPLLMAMRQSPDSVLAEYRFSYSPDMMPSWFSDHSGSIQLAACVGVVGAAACLSYLAPRLERGQRAGFPIAIALVFALAAGIIVSICRV